MDEKLVRLKTILEERERVEHAHPSFPMTPVFTAQTNYDTRHETRDCRLALRYVRSSRDGLADASPDCHADGGGVRSEIHRFSDLVLIHRGLIRSC